MNYSIIDDNLTNPEFFAQGDVHALFRRLRAEDPVHWTQGRLTHGFWSVTKYKDMQTIYSDPITFSSQRGGSILPTSKDTEEVGEEEKKRYGIELVNTDPPRHRQLRRLMDPAFRKAVVLALAPTVRGVVSETLDDIEPKVEFDFVSDLAMRVPTAMICKIMGVPSEDWSKLIQWTSMALSQEDSSVQIEGGASETKAKGFGNMVEYCNEFALQKRRSPGTDLTSIIATSEIEGEKLTEVELAWNTLILVMAGLETARNAIAGGMLALWEHPEQMDILSAKPDLVPSAVEEILRWTSPATHNRRTATKDFELRGKVIREGDWVVLWLPSANRDEDIFKDPYSFDISRSSNRHMAFGYGVHHCIGRELARLEIQHVLEETVRRQLRFDVTGQVERVKTNLVAGIKRMPVRIRKSCSTVTA